MKNVVYTEKEWIKRWNELVLSSSEIFYPAVVDAPEKMEGAMFVGNVDQKTNIFVKK